MAASLEFFILVSVALLIVLSIISYTSSFYISIYKEKVWYEIENIADLISSEINLAVFAGDGYERKFFISSEGYNFTIEIDNYFVKINYKELAFYKPIYVKNITGIIKFDNFNIIKNVNGKIYIE
ncbi:MAG: hypothetical protein RMJ17_00160 [Candidatus Aenigmarchaeota archaeon]|nr:hypothetical protein [Candidatus Aenigmarchaeota archaeon]MDW8149005.1 hypothetical protein [Candidatus Aenigmarchaeota archaeon]